MNEYTAKDCLDLLRFLGYDKISDSEEETIREEWYKYYLLHVDESSSEDRFLTGICLAYRSARFGNDRQRVNPKAERSDDRRMSERRADDIVNRIVNAGLKVKMREDPSKVLDEIAA